LSSKEIATFSKTMAGRDLSTCEAAELGFGMVGVAIGYL
jgi:hypothetical protein